MQRLGHRLGQVAGVAVLDEKALGVVEHGAFPPAAVADHHFKMRFLQPRQMAVGGGFHTAVRIELDAAGIAVVADHTVGQVLPGGAFAQYERLLARADENRTFPFRRCRQVIAVGSRVVAVDPAGEQLPPAGTVQAGGCRAGRQPVPVVVGIHQRSRAVLLEVVQAGRGARPFPRLVQRRQQHACEDRDDRYHHYDHLLNIQYGVY